MNKLEFSEWLNEERNKRGWTQNELARRAGMTSSGVSQVITRRTFPGPEFCRGVARALGVPPERVFRKAGLLPPRIIGGDNSEERKKLLDYFDAVGKHERQAILAVASTLYEQRTQYAIEIRPDEKED